MGGLKNNWPFWRLKRSLRLSGPRGEWGCESQKGAFMMSRRPCVSPGNMSFQWWLLFGRFGFPRVCPPINSALYLLFAFFSTAFSWEAFFFLLLLRPLLFLSKETRKHFCTGDFVSRHSFAAGVLVSKQRSFFFRASFGTCTFAIAVPFVGFCWFFGFGF